MRPCQHFPIPPQPPGRGAEGEPADAYSHHRVLQESVPEATVHTLRELGAFKLQVRLSLVSVWALPTPSAYRVHWSGNFHRSSPVHLLQPQGRLRSRLHDCPTEAQKQRIQGRRPWATCSTTGMNSSTSASLGSQTWPVTPSQLWL